LLLFLEKEASFDELTRFREANNRGRGLAQKSFSSLKN
jgi:hypothetical protein